MDDQTPDKSRFPAEESKFVKGEVALCFYNAILYDVKCVDVRKNGNTWEVKVHYLNFATCYDQYVDEINVLKTTPANIARQKDLVTYSKKFTSSRKQLSSNKSNNRRRSQLNLKNTDSISSYKTVSKNKEPKTARHTSFYNRLKFVSVPTKLELPDELIRWLSYDWYQVHEKKRQLVTPARFSVINVINDYYAYQINIVVSSKCELLRDFVIRLEKLFSEAVKNLLHESEVNKYEDNLETSEFSLCQRYGSFHFLRLIGRIAEHYSEICPEEEEETFWDHLDDLVIYLVNNEAELFKVEDFSPS